VKKLRLLLLDANVVIEISRHALWDPVVDRCEIHLARTVIDEAVYFLDDDGFQRGIDLRPYIEAGSIKVFDLVPSDLETLRSRFDPTYFEKLDPGETESLAYLLQQHEMSCMISSTDKIVYRILGNLNRAEQGISLEEILKRIGLGRALSREFSRDYRRQWTQRGFEDGLAGMGWRGDA